jgi:ProP effector
MPAPNAKAPPRTRVIPPALETLAALYPALFGAVFRPLKRGIFQDILAAQPEGIEREALKEALALHTRSTRYLSSVAAGMARHDLQGQAVEDMAPEHVHHALVEVYKRRLRQGPTKAAQPTAGRRPQRPAAERTPETLRAQLIERIAQVFAASGLSREAYGDLVRSKDDAANAALDEAMALASERIAKDEALLRAFDASGQTTPAFAEMYGMEPAAAEQTLARARKRREPAQA